MCFSHLTNEPLSLPSTAQAGGSMGDPGDGMGSPSIGPSNLAPNSGTANVPVRTPTTMGHILTAATGGLYDPSEGMGGASPTGRLTKWGALAKIMRPALEGAAVGGFLGRSTPEGGFGAANSYFLNQRARQMQFAELMRQLTHAQSTISKNQAETGFYNRGGGTRIGQPVIGDNGNYWQTDPVTRELTDTGVKAKAPKGTPDQFEWNTDEQGNKTGVLVDRANATARTVTIKGVPTTAPGRSTPDGNAASQVASDIAGLSGESAGGPSRVAQRRMPTKFDSGGPRVAGATSSSPSASPDAINADTGNIPRTLSQSASTAPKPVTRTIRNAAGVETDVMVDGNPKSVTFGQTIKKTGVTRQPIPDRAGNRESTRADQKNSDIARSEQYAAAALAKSGGDPDRAVQSLNNLKIADPDAAEDLNRLLPQIRKSITDRAKQRKPKVATPFGLSPKDWGALTGNQTPQDQYQDQP
jgi:hypothetical protein